MGIKTMESLKTKVAYFLVPTSGAFEAHLTLQQYYDTHSEDLNERRYMTWIRVTDWVEIDLPILNDQKTAVEALNEFNQ
jgi:hypothetical protein